MVINMNKTKSLIVLLGCILICGIVILVKLFASNDTDEMLKNYPQEIQDVYKITKNVFVSGMQEEKEYDYQILDDKNKCMMLFNYLNYKGWLKDEISFDTMDIALNSLFGNSFDYGNLLYTYEKYVYQNDGTKIIRNVLTSETSYDYETKIENYHIDGNLITLDMKVDGSANNAIYQYIFEKNSNDYRLQKIYLNPTR